MDIFRQAIVLCSTVLALNALSGCAVRPLVLNQVADALAMPGQDLEDDIHLAREASAFYLKLSESVLRETPGNLKLAESVTSGFTQYAYAFVSLEADQLQSKDARACCSFICQGAWARHDGAGENHARIHQGLDEPSARWCFALV